MFNFLNISPIRGRDVYYVSYCSNVIGMDTTQCESIESAINEVVYIIQATVMRNESLKILQEFDVGTVMESLRSKNFSDPEKLWYFGFKDILTITVNKEKSYVKAF